MDYTDNNRMKRLCRLSRAKLATLFIEEEARTAEKAAAIASLRICRDEAVEKLVAMGKRPPLPNKELERANKGNAYMRNQLHLSDQLIRELRALVRCLMTHALRLPEEGPQ